MNGQEDTHNGILLSFQNKCNPIACYNMDKNENISLSEMGKCFQWPYNFGSCNWKSLKHLFVQSVDMTNSKVHAKILR